MNNWIFQSDAGSICFDVSMNKWSTSDFKWIFGNCSSSHKWLGPGMYTEKCCMQEGNHVLTCSTSRNKNDWSNTDLRMLGHRFCDDFVGYEELIELNISGTIEIWASVYILIFPTSQYCSYKYLDMHIINWLLSTLALTNLQSPFDDDDETNHNILEGELNCK